MLTLHVFGPAFGLPDASPFCTKALVLMKMSGLSFTVDTKGFRKAPKGKQPYLDDDGVLIADSTFIRWHLETRHGIEFDRGLTSSEQAVAWAFEKLLEDNLYWVILDARWMVDANFQRGPRSFFEAVPAPMRPLVTSMVRRGVRKALHAHGMGRHGRPEIERIGTRTIDAIADFLAGKPWLMGAEPCGTDATLFAFVSSLLCPRFETPLLAATRRHTNLVAYAERGRARWFPELEGAPA